jgi:peptidoglycan/xylan/chitin deacetylase (PgdA/CDA1 family)
MSNMKSVLKFIFLRLVINPITLSQRLRAIRSSDAVIILSLHRVCEDDGSAYKPLCPELFKSLLEFLLSNFELTTFRELNCPHRGKPKLILSFDDGYRDFLDVVVPILWKHRVAVNQNIIPLCVESGEPPLNVLVQDFIGQAPFSLRAEFNISGLNLRGLEGDPVRMGLKASAFLKNKPIAEQRLFRIALEPQLRRLNKFQPTRMMSRTDVKQILEEHEIGVHSFEHASMASESEEYFISDLDKCREYFLEAFNIPATIYAFPNGSHRTNQAHQALKSGYKNILLVDNDYSMKHFNVHSRFGIHAESEREVLFRAMGGTLQPQNSARIAKKI